MRRPGAAILVLATFGVVLMIVAARAVIVPFARRSSGSSAEKTPMHDDLEPASGAERIYQAAVDPRPSAAAVPSLLGSATSKEPDTVTPIESDPGLRMTQEESARKRVGTLLQQLEASGPAAGGWTSTVFGVFEKWKASSPSPDKIDLSEFRCFRSGCTATTTGDAGAMAAPNADPEEMHRLDWNGPWFRSGPMQDSGRTKFVWIVYRTESAPRPMEEHR
jgi:hypothetical protein